MALKGRARPNQAGDGATALRPHRCARLALQTVRVDLYGCDTFHMFCPCMVKFIYSEKATKFCKISTNYLTGSTKDKKLVEILQNSVAYSEYITTVLKNDIILAIHLFSKYQTKVHRTFITEFEFNFLL